MNFIFGPTRDHALKYCELHELNPEEYAVLDLDNSWADIEEKLIPGLGEDSRVMVLDNDYLDNPVLFQNIMSYLEEHEASFKLEIVENVYLD